MYTKHVQSGNGVSDRRNSGAHDSAPLLCSLCELNGLSMIMAVNHPTRGSLFSALLACLLAIALTGQSYAAERKLVTVPLPARPYRTTDARGMVRVIPAQAVADRLIVKLRPHVGPRQIGPLAVATGTQIEKVLPISGMLVVNLAPGSDLLAAAQAFSRRPEVEFAVPDTLVYPALVPDDPEYDKQWHLPKIDAPHAWDEATGSSTVTIAIIDSGCDLDHPDLANKIWTNPGEVPGNGQDDDGNGYIDDVYGWDFYNDDDDPTPEPTGGADENVSHGTLVAGTAGAVGNEGWGAAGVDWQAKLMILQVFPASGGGSVSKVVEAIDYATANGADIINLSLGSPYSSAFSPPIHRAYEAGKIVVCAAGNGGTEFTAASSTWESPACNDGPSPLIDNYVLSVAATDRYDRKESHSNYDSSGGKLVDVAAPGQVIYGPTFYEPAFPKFDEYWGTNTGTSFSCPIVSGIAGLLIAQNPALRGNPATVYELIRNTTDDIDAQNPGYAGKLGTGRVNAARALGLPTAPEPVTDLVAGDTVGDQGGSITLTWVKSVDDGGGNHSVTSYIVRRRTGLSAPFTDIVALLPGTEQYHDGSVTDGIDYYYLVRTTSPSTYADSETVGPVQSRDDSSPPQITTLIARDRPSDSGGAIELAWTYTPPDDFAFYRLYRSHRDFTTVEGRTPLITFSDPATTSWTDTSVVDGADYYYAITATDEDDNEYNFVQTAGPVQSYPNNDIPFDAGVQFLSAPAIPLDQHPATLFGLNPAELIGCYARYDRLAEEYVIYAGDPLPEILQLALARGFWVNLASPVTVTPEGASAPGGDFDVPLEPGWQMSGNPFFGPIDFGACTVTHQGNTMDLLSAYTQHIISAIAWIYDPADAGYKIVAGDAVGQRQIAPWRGFWLLAYQPCTLTIPRPTGVVSVPQEPSQSPPNDGDWSLRLVASSATSRDTDNFCGLRPRAVITEVDNPPAVSGGVDLYIMAADSDRRLAASYDTHAAREHEWDVVVTWSQPHGEVSISWPDIAALPRGHTAVLTDLDGGATVNLRLQSRYTFTAEQPGSRHFALSVTPTADQPVMLTSIAAVPRSGGGELVFTLSQPAQCDIRIMNIAGRTIRVLERNQARAAGQSIVPWNGRADTGSSVPSGRYLIQVEAAAANGTVARALRSLNVTR